MWNYCASETRENEPLLSSSGCGRNQSRGRQSYLLGPIWRHIATEAQSSARHHRKQHPSTGLCHYFLEYSGWPQAPGVWAFSMQLSDTVLKSAVAPTSSRSSMGIKHLSVSRLQLSSLRNCSLVKGFSYCFNSSAVQGFRDWLLPRGLSSPRPVIPRRRSHRIFFGPE
jgi:hypothetical protein